MARIEYNGHQFDVPDDATDEEIGNFIDSGEADRQIQGMVGSQGNSFQNQPNHPNVSSMFVPDEAINQQVLDSDEYQNRKLAEQRYEAQRRPVSQNAQATEYLGREVKADVDKKKAEEYADVIFKSQFDKGSPISYEQAYNAGLKQVERDEQDTNRMVTQTAAGLAAAPFTGGMSLLPAMGLMAGVEATSGAAFDYATGREITPVSVGTDLASGALGEVGGRAVGWGIDKAVKADFQHRLTNTIINENWGKEAANRGIKVGEKETAEEAVKRSIRDDVEIRLTNIGVDPKPYSDDVARIADTEYKDLSKAINSRSSKEAESWVDFDLARKNNPGLDSIIDAVRRAEVQKEGVIEQQLKSGAWDSFHAESDKATNNYLKGVSDFDKLMDEKLITKEERDRYVARLNDELKTELDTVYNKYQNVRNEFGTEFNNAINKTEVPLYDKDGNIIGLTNIGSLETMGKSANILAGMNEANPQARVGINTLLKNIKGVDDEGLKILADIAKSNRSPSEVMGQRLADINPTAAEVVGLRKSASELYAGRKAAVDTLATKLSDDISKIGNNDVRSALQSKVDAILSGKKEAFGDVSRKVDDMLSDHSFQKIATGYHQKAVDINRELDTLINIYRDLKPPKETGIKLGSKTIPVGAVGTMAADIIFGGGVGTATTLAAGAAGIRGGLGWSTSRMTAKAKKSLDTLAKAFGGEIKYSKELENLIEAGAPFADLVRVVVRDQLNENVKK